MPNSVVAQYVEDLEAALTATRKAADGVRALFVANTFPGGVAHGYDRRHGIAQDDVDQRFRKLDAVLKGPGQEELVMRSAAAHKDAIAEEIDAAVAREALRDVCELFYMNEDGRAVVDHNLVGHQAWRLSEGASDKIMAARKLLGMGRPRSDVYLPGA